MAGQLRPHEVVEGAAEVAVEGAAAGVARDADPGALLERVHVLLKDEVAQAGDVDEALLGVLVLDDLNEVGRHAVARVAGHLVGVHRFEVQLVGPLGPGDGDGVHLVVPQRPHRHRVLDPDAGHLGVGVRHYLPGVDAVGHVVVHGHRLLALEVAGGQVVVGDLGAGVRTLTRSRRDHRGGGAVDRGHG